MRDDKEVTKNANTLAAWIIEYFEEREKYFDRQDEDQILRLAYRVKQETEWDL
jgi:hypothetical protein